MKAMLKKAAAVVSAAVLCVAAVGCSNKDTESSKSESNLVGGPSDGMSLDEEDMPYGATMTSLKSSTNDKLTLDADFDPRYFAQEGTDYPEIYLISNYLTALQNGDEDAMKEIFYAPYLERSVKERNYESVKDYLEKYLDVLMTKAHGQFEFTYFTVDTCLNENESEDLTSFSEIDAKLDLAAGEKLSEKVKSRKLVYLDVTLKDVENKYYQLNSYLGYDISVYVYNIDGKYYLL